MEIKMIKKTIKKVSLNETIYALKWHLPLYIKRGNDWCLYNFDENYASTNLISDLYSETFGLERSNTNV